MTKWIRADHALAEKEAAVAAEREACASRLESLKDTAYQNNLLAEGVTYSCAIKAIRARADTDALAERDAQVRAEALREAAVSLKTYAPHLVDGPEHDVGYYHGYYTAVDRILNLALLGRAALGEKTDDE